MERQRKRELRELNAKAWAGENVLSVSTSLNSSLKNNTAFIKRLRTAVTASSQAQFLQEIRTLSLHKYLSEIISACYEGLCKLKSPGEIATGVEIVSALHQRFGPGEFTGYLSWYIGRGLATPDKSMLKQLAQELREKEEKDRLTRQRVLLRVATELWLVGVLRSLEDVTRPEEAAKGKENVKLVEASSKTKATASGNRTDVDAEPFPLEVLKDMLGHDREHINLPLVVIFVKAFAWDILGSKSYSTEGRKTVNEEGGTHSEKNEESSPVDEDESAAQDPPLTFPELRQRFKNILTRYFEDVKAHLLRDQKHLVNQGRKNAEAYVKSGEVFEDRQANYEKQVKAQERLASNAQVLADALGAEMPDLKEKDSSAAAGDGTIGLVKAGDYLRGQGDGPGIWEDEEERRFYENLIDLKDRVPGILLEEPKKKKAEDEQVGKKVESKSGGDEERTPEAKPAEMDDQSTAIANKSVGAQVDALLARLPELNGKDAIDQTAMDFCFLNSKASRNRLIKAVEDIPKGRSDLLPIYSRLIATLGKYMPDVSQGLVSYLDEEFRSLQRRKSKDFLGQVRTQNVRYLAELTKFGVVPEHVIFHCLKVSLDDFTRMNIEIICNLLENCGRYLLRNPETSPRMASFLETLQRKKTAQVIGQQERMLIENAMYYVNPPDRAAIEQKERTPIELFLRKLIYTDLSKRTLDKIVKQIRKLHWEEDEIVKLLHKIFTKPGKIKYSNIHLLAVILGTLYKYHQDFGISVIDDLLESITFGLELNDFKFNQRRIAEVKYLGELYIYRMVESPLIFDTMYKLLNYGYKGGYATPGVMNPWDLPDDYFRIRLVCTLLEICGMYYDKGASKKKLDIFLCYFQFYICLKDSLPMDVEFMVQDAYNAVRPQWKLITNLEEAFQIFADSIKQNTQSTATDKPTEVDDEEASASDDDADGPDDEDVALPEGEDDKSSGEDAEGSGDDEPEEQASDEEEEEQIVVTRPEDERDPEAEAEFDRELAKMMTESLDSRKFERKPVFDVPLPMRRAREAAAGAEDSGGEPSISVPPPTTTMKFSLLSKRGNKQQTRSIDLPSDSTFALAMRSKQQAEKEEQQRIKSLVLNYDLSNDNDDGESPFHSPLHPNPNWKRTKTDEGLDKTHNPYAQPRLDKGGNNRSNQRARKLQLSDVNWYGESPSSQGRLSSQSQSSQVSSSPTTRSTESKVSARRGTLLSSQPSVQPGRSKDSDAPKDTRSRQQRNYGTVG